MFGLTFEKILVISIIAAAILGPRRLPGAAAALGRMVRGLRSLARDTTERLREEVGPEFDEIDWTRLDPRQYDPRRIIRDALTVEPEPSTSPPRDPDRPSGGSDTADGHAERAGQDQPAGPDEPAGRSEQAEQVGHGTPGEPGQSS